MKNTKQACFLCRRLTVLTDIYTDGVDVGEVGHGRPHGSTGGPHVVEEEDRHGREAEHAQPGHAQNVREEHKLGGHAEAAHQVTRKRQQKCYISSVYIYIYTF